ncbi:50S ribosomal protein L15 [Candidatus Roizmanbacteria bacterium RIFCSPLOWO2_12_FULL_40_12]|uniref:Large ribosomal subunit protein uL15 n=1 Tax=Candidatus Roizmanbacteria bacterium RIFCSPLOWO2_01_FULL_40_42 TaxID=1802066 RepID=A0A1F7J4I2_9BACT|nr:MAG: 50S ribosomal protein L15 [Candidatus Roizmanbacteria bacterium RIFCSPHIGHO2_01_FULL_40_98]OGK27288.1 MAG: 50S ribosomal protein L15 [Candidatus Roizmanbacteria bacterium RIFCSPHIGHO2_02_FULL_40_53]OGK30840.1 MAG: 50S ribosomal protein L15 [Candidatus Roizmanbacteria bacterium RIFCSPHIGHO2_12_41_18]OGK36393.1 MAG: 50S ribosomal protein L15 [Candidatus Roizmanbacteria bacterium RIFCSPHIGHO2_12_FULL_40_130]OGK50521.1 MAG: 50S ribosomal protein L15 [Candidatus Roizmanbacteria bacterium RIF
MGVLLSQLPKMVNRKKKRVGRGSGSGRGAKSGRGTTRHQKARSNIPLHFEGGQAKMVKKYPLLRGKGKNKSVKREEQSISLTSLNKLKVNEVVDLANLLKYGIIDTQRKTTRVRIVATGTLDKKLIVRLPVSKKAGKLIEKVGGKIETPWKK